MDLLNTCSHMDIFDLCDCLEDDSVDQILADLPYGITACEWDNVIPFDDMWECFKRIIKPRGAVVLTASGKFTYKLVMSNFEWFKYEWVWDKVNMYTNQMLATIQPLKNHETVLVFGHSAINYYPQYRKSKPYNVKRAGKIKAYHIKRNNGINQTGDMYPGTVIKLAARNPNQQGYHPTQKPVALFEYLIRTYTQPGETVFDPCVGSGTTAIAARNTGRNYIVGDSSAEYVQVARDRLAKPYTLPLFDETRTEQEKPEQMTMGI